MSANMHHYYGLDGPVMKDISDDDFKEMLKIAENISDKNQAEEEVRISID